MSYNNVSGIRREDAMNPASTAKNKVSDRSSRLAAALRGNLKKRKGRQTSATPPGSEAEAAGDRDDATSRPED
jgi:hypothetical protein